jgi:sporulation protein YlmC with PRC-barrel domain
MSSYSRTTGQAHDISANETSTLIAASKVNGTSVQNRTGESLGSIYDVMIDKQTGRVSYAIMSFGGFLGMGESYHPLPWHVLQYDSATGSYIVDIAKDKLEGGPSYAPSASPDWTTGRYGKEVDTYYGAGNQPL